MPKAVDPQPRENLLNAPQNSPMNFMKEHLVHDSETESLVRFRSGFIMPDWTNVEDNEFDYVIDETWKTLYHVAQEIYGDPMLEFVIAARNHLDLPDAQVYKGLILKVPNKDWVESKLLPQGRTIRNAV